MKASSTYPKQYGSIVSLRSANCTGMTQSDGMRREVEGGFRMGKTRKSMADSCQCMAKTTTIL